MFKKAKEIGVICLLSSTFFLLISCSKKLVAEKPILSKTDFRIDSLPNSELNIPIVVNLKLFYAEAEKKIDTVFTSPNWPNDWIVEGCDTRYKYYFRRGPLLLKASGNILNLGFTGYYKIIGSTRACTGSTAISPWTPACKCGFDEGERKVNVSFLNSISILPDYKAKMWIQRLEPQPVDKCQVCFWGQDITREVMNGLKADLDLAKKGMEDSFGVIDLKPRFQQVWDKLNTSYNVYGLGWLQINPQRLRINNLFARNDSLYIFFGLSARPVISFEKPAEQFSRVPNLSDFSHNQGFNIFLDAVLNYDSLSNILNAQVRGKRFDFDKGPVKKYMIIKECKLSGMNNEKLIIKVDFEGSDKGTAYFTGKPEYNIETRTIEIKDLDFDIRTKNLFMSTASWLFNRRIITELQHNSRFDLSGYIDTAIVTANQQLNREIMKGVYTYGSLNEIKLLRMYPLKEHLIIRSACKGDLSIKVESISFSF